MPSTLIQLGDFFSKLCALSDLDFELLEKHWSSQRLLKRNEFLISPGQIELRVYFVLRGTFRIYYPYEDQEICVGFAYPDTVLCAYPSLIRNLPSQYYIQCLRAASLLSVSWTDYQSMMEASSTFRTLWDMQTQEALLGKIEREAEMLTFTPTQRVERLVKRSPHLFQWIPKKYIASYLRMSPETLSRIRLTS